MPVQPTVMLRNKNNIQLLPLSSSHWVRVSLYQCEFYEKSDSIQGQAAQPSLTRKIREEREKDSKLISFNYNRLEVPSHKVASNKLASQKTELVF